MPSPPSIVLDYAALFAQAPNIAFAAPGRCSACRDLGARYAELLQRQAGMMPFWTSVGRARRHTFTSRSRRGSVGHRQAFDDGVSPQGLRDFLHFAVWRLEELTWNASGTGPPCACLGARGNASAPGAYLQALTDAGNGAPDALLVAEDAPLWASSAMVAAGIHAPRGMDAVDLPLLHALGAYRPVALADLSRETHDRLCRLVGPPDNRAGRRPDFGRPGLTPKGKISELRPIELLRDDLVTRICLKHVLYRERRAPSEMPIQLRICLILALGDEMQRRGVGQRRLSSLARQAVALWLEDIVRCLSQFSAIQLTVGILLHNDSPAAWACRAFVPSCAALAWADDESSASFGGGAWLLRVPGLQPHYFLREPEWPEMKPGGPTPREPAARALAALEAALARGDSPESDGRSSDSLSVIVTVGADGPGPRADWRPPGCGRPDVAHWDVRIGERSMSVRASPALSGVPMEQSFDFDDSGACDDGARAWPLADLGRRLVRISAAGGR